MLIPISMDGLGILITYDKSPAKLVAVVFQGAMPGQGMKKDYVPGLDRDGDGSLYRFTTIGEGFLTNPVGTPFEGL